MNIAGKKVSQIIFISVILLTFFSCTKSTTCLTPKVVSLRGGFYYDDSVNVFKDSLQTNANLFFGSISTYFINLKQTSKFYLSLSQSNDDVTIYFQSDSANTDPATIDTLSLNYTREPHFISTACGYETFFTIQQVNYSTNIIDTVIVNDYGVNNDVNKEHLKIVIRK